MNTTTDTGPARQKLEWWRRLYALSNGAYAGSSPMWTFGLLIIVTLILLPIAVLVVLGLVPAENIWPHLMRTVLPGAIADTLLLMLGVGALTLIIGVSTAWLVSMYSFPGRDALDWLLLLPLAMPTYIIAYCYGDILDFSGPVQLTMRDAFGWTSSRDYWFPEIRSLPGAIFVMGLVLYPYVYLSARASFLQQSICALEVSRTLGRTTMGAFWSVALPLSRPALVAGVMLALMECLNDIGAVEYLGVDTLTISIYSTWLERSNLGGAAQLACVMLVFVITLYLLERVARRRQRFHQTSSKYRPMPAIDLTGARGVIAFGVCALPLTLGFVVPALLLVSHSITFSEAAFATDKIWSAMGNSLLLSSVSAAVAVGLGLLIAYTLRIKASPVTRMASRLAGFGYAVPGTVLALGILIPLAWFDNAFDAMMRSTFGISTGLLLSGSIVALVFAYTIRFMAVSLGAIDAGFERISPSLDAAARTLGETARSTLTRIHFPLLRPALGAAALLVFVDSMKELPATLLLRPFNFDTLATFVYANASLEQFEEAAPAALMIVLLGLLPLVLLHRAVVSGRPGASKARAE